jgi:hypothetical protein
MLENLSVPILTHIETSLNRVTTIRLRDNISDFNGDIHIMVKIGWSLRRVIENLQYLDYDLIPN